MSAALAEALSRWAARSGVSTLAVSGLRRVSGGASMETWLFQAGPRALVLRRAPGGQPLHRALGPSLALQAALMRAAAAQGVRVPEVVAVLQPADGLGEGFVMAQVPGETLPARIQGQPDFATARERLVDDCARELSRIHRIAADTLPEALAELQPAQALAELQTRLQASGARLPVLELALGWLARGVPEAVPPVVLHGDFRLGNLMVDGQGLAAVLDWELAHRGDPAQDLAYLCLPSWRFGHPEQPVAGIGEVAPLLEAYARQGGRPIDPARWRWWLVHGTVWWGLTCLTMAQLWREGVDRALERLVIGRRVSEVELDLLLLLEPDLAPPAAPRLPWPEEPATPVRGEVAAFELLGSLRDWAQAQSERTEGFARFEARVAANAAGLVEREARPGPRFQAAQRQRLQTLGLAPEALGAQLRAAAMPLDAALWNHLRATALERIAIDQPRYPGARMARARWGQDPLQGRAA